MRELGRVVRLQVQTGSLKLGERPNRVYDPGAAAGRHRAAALAAGRRGRDAARRGRPRRPSRGPSRLEGGTRARGVLRLHGPLRDDAGALRGAHGSRLRGREHPRRGAGCAPARGVRPRARVPERFDRRASAARGSRGRRSLRRVLALLARGPAEASPQDLKPVLQFLGDGLRGYCFTPAGDFTLRPGDALVAAG